MPLGAQMVFLVVPLITEEGVVDPAMVAHRIGQTVFR